MEPLIPINRIIEVIGKDAMFHIDVTAVELNAIVRITLDLDIVHGGTTTYGNQRNPVDLVTFTELVTALGNNHILKDATVIQFVVSPGKA